MQNTRTNNFYIGDCLNRLYPVSRNLKKRVRRRRILITGYIYLNLLKIHNNIWNINNMNIYYNKKKYKHHIQNFFGFNILATRIAIGLCNIS